MHGTTQTFAKTKHRKMRCFELLPNLSGKETHFKHFKNKQTLKWNILQSRPQLIVIYGLICAKYQAEMLDTGLSM